MRVLRFLLLICFWLLCFSAVVAIYFYRSPELFLEEAEGKLSILGLIWKKGISYFRYAGSWNYVVAAFALCGSTLVFVVIDLAIERYIKSRERTNDIYKFGVRWIGQRVISSGLTIVLLSLVANAVIYLYSSSKIYEEASKVPAKNVALLLGTNKHLRNGKGENLYYTYRINAAAELYLSGKIGHIVISGDRTIETNYNEPLDMKMSLMEKGVPGRAVTLDYAGYRTLDSIVRLKHVFDVKDVVVISQTFHLERALLLSWFYNINAIGFAADGSMTEKMVARELLAKPKALLDVFVFNMQPKEGQSYVKSSVDWDSGHDVTFVYWTGLLTLFTAGVLLFSFTTEK